MQFLASFRHFCRSGRESKRLRHPAPSRVPSLVLIVALAGNAPAGFAQQPPTAPATSAPAATPASSAAAPAFSGSQVTEEELRRQLVGKPLFLRRGYLGDSLNFNEHGEATGHPAQGSFTLSGVQIDKVKLTRHKVELEGARYALHYVAGLPDADASKDVDRIRTTPKKKSLKITIDREQVVKAKTSKEKGRKDKNAAPPARPASPQAVVNQPAGGEPGASTVTPVGSASNDKITPNGRAADTPAEEAAEQGTPADKATGQPSVPTSVTTTASPAHAAATLRGALDRVFATGLDARLQDQMPDFWQLYFKAQASGTEYRPHDPKVLRSNAVDQQARVLSSLAPDSNEFAQANGISGRALYRAVIGADGQPGEIAVVRPIGFGLDEKAVQAIQKARFQPAVKAGQPVAETLDLAVVFRIYSKRTGVSANQVEAGPQPAAVKPGPYSAKPQ